MKQGLCNTKRKMWTTQEIFFMSYQVCVWMFSWLCCFRWWFMDFFVCVCVCECMPADECERSVWERTGHVCVKYCCQRYLPTVEECLHCPPCGADFPSGSKVTQLWFDIVCECIWCVCVCLWERGIQSKSRSVCLCTLHARILFMSIWVFLGDYMI